ncbi:MAG: hypothetical protein R2851_25685 [Caldilineaceae bacterium]
MTWDVSCDAGWVTMHEQDDQLILSVDACGGTEPSEYTTTVQISVPDSLDIARRVGGRCGGRAKPPGRPATPRRRPTIALLPPQHLVYLPYTMRR